MKVICKVKEKMPTCMEKKRLMHLILRYIRDVSGGENGGGWKRSVRNISIHVTSYPACICYANSAASTMHAILSPTITSLTKINVSVQHFVYKLLYLWLGWDWIIGQLKTLVDGVLDRVQSKPYLGVSVFLKSYVTLPSIPHAFHGIFKVI